MKRLFSGLLMLLLASKAFADDAENRRIEIEIVEADK